MANYTETELKKLKKADLFKIASVELEIDEDELAGQTKPLLIETILQVISMGEVDDDELDDEELDDELDDEVIEDDEDLDDEDEDELDDEEIEEDEPAPTPKAKKAKKPDMHDGEAVLAAKQVAALLNTDAKTLRQFFRSPASTYKPVGSGGRYEFLESDVDGIRNEFATWMQNKTARKAKPAGGSTSRKSKARVVPDEEILPEVDDLDEELDDLLDELDDELDDEVDDDELDD